MQIKLSSDRIRALLDADPLQLPPYTSQLLNLANQNAQGTRPRVVGQMSELIQEFDGKTLQEWEAWYLGRYADRLTVAKDRIKAMVTKLQAAILAIDDQMIDDWLRDLVIVKTFVGLRFQEAILAEVSRSVDGGYRLSEPSEEARGIDGFINGVPVSIKPVTYKVKSQLAESLQGCLIYYEKIDNDLRVEFNEKDLKP
ncbi:MAG TPA: MjaI family restriction endonuclease [bacterium]